MFFRRKKPETTVIYIQERSAELEEIKKFMDKNGIPSVKGLLYWAEKGMKYGMAEILEQLKKL